VIAGVGLRGAVRATRAARTLADGARRAGRLALDLLLPTACVACDRTLDAGEPGLVCGRCWARAGSLPHPHCERCGHPTGGRACAWCAALPAYVRAARSACWAHDGAGRAIVHALKYGGWERAADGMAARMARLPWPADVVEERTALVPVPLSAARRRERGYNQSERLAAALGARLGVAVWDDVVERARDTRSQTRLTPDQRLGNVSGAFRVADRGRIAGAHLVLVDDVVTTAATLNACAAALFEGGARILSYVTFGRAPAPGDRT
jgi:ComF family protein